MVRRRLAEQRVLAEGSQVEVSVVMPCLNEEATVGCCVEQALTGLAILGVRGEVVVVDNNSTDTSAEVALEAGARVVHESLRGYGCAYRRGLAEARGQYVVFADSDGSYDFTDLKPFIEPLRSGADLVMGSRLRGTIEPGAMPWLHRYLGNPLLTGFLNLVFRTHVSDAHCGMRSLRRSAYRRLEMTSTGMEFASELIIEAARQELKIAEVPIRYAIRGGGKPKLRTWRDGWRHLWLMFKRAPSPVVVVPALGLAGVSAGLGPLAARGFLRYQWLAMPLVGEGLLLAVLIGRQLDRRTMSLRQSSPLSLRDGLTPLRTDDWPPRAAGSGG